MEILETQLDIVKKFVDNSVNNICYISAPKNITERIPEYLGADFKLIDIKNDFSPFKPFLSIISNKHPSEELIKKSAYLVQEQSFQSFFQNGLSDERYDIPLENETVYETNRFIHTICTLLQELPQENFLIINSQTLQNNSLKLLEELEKCSLKGKFVLCFNTDYSDGNTSVSSDFFEKNSNKRNFLYLKAKISLSEQSMFTAGIATKQEAAFSNEELFKNLRNNRIFMAYEQLNLVSEIAAKKAMDMNFADLESRKLLLELAKAYFALVQYDKAILYFNAVIESEKKDDLSLAALYYLVVIFYYKKSADLAKRYSKKLMEIFETNRDSPYFTLFQMTTFQFSAFDNLTENIKQYNNILALLEKKGFINNYISTGLSIPWSLINDSSNRDFVYGNIEKCYQLAKQIDNQHLVSKACHWKGIIHSHYGEAEEAMKWYFECNQIRTEIGEIVPIMNIRNGLSYESSLRSKYENAYNLINDVIKNLYNLSDYSTVIDTLKNIGYSLFYSRHFSQADSIFTRILHYIHLFNYEKRSGNSFLPSVNDMLIFKSIIEINENDYIHARINYTRIMQDPIDITSEDKPLLYFVKAALLLEDQNFEEAYKAIDESINEFKKIKSNQSHKICFVYYEFAVLLNKLGMLTESENYLNKGFQLAKEKSFEHYCKHKQELSVYDYLRDVHDFAPLNIDLSFLDEKANKEVLLNQLHKRLHDYQFLNKIKATSLQNPSLQQYIKKVSESIFDYTMAESVFFCEYVANRYETIHCVARTESATLDSEKWWSLFQENTNQSFAQLVYSQNQDLFFANISQFDYKFGIAIKASKENPLNSEYIAALNIAISNIQAQIIIFKQNENLLFLSTTDQLSLLNNRHALQQYILKESDKIRRYRQRKSANIQIAIAFIDLDNFKYYNDTFGHSAGDLLIACFASLLKRTCRQIDFLARFGGDEFVIIMADTSENEALRVNQRLKENLEAAEHFIPELKKHLDKADLQIPKNKFLDFSMGISTNFDDEDYEDLNKVMIKADQALYYSKVHNKGSATPWKSISKKHGEQ